MGKYYRYYVLIMVTVVSMVNIADRLIMSILMEDIKAEFHLSDTQVGLLVGLAFALFYALMSFPIARWADIGNRKNILSLAVILWSGMTALCGAAVGFYSLFFARLGVGVGEAGGSPPTYSLIADYFKPSERARAMGVYMVGAALGTGGGLIIGGILGEMLGWRTTFLVLGIPGVLLGLLFFFTVKEPQRGRLDAGEAKDKQAKDINKTLKSLAANPVFIRISVSFAMLTMIGYAMAFWLAPIMLRNFDVSLGKVGLYLGLTYIAAGIPAPLIGGYLTDYMAKRDARWLAWIPAIAIVIVSVALWFCVMADSFEVFLSFFVLAYFVFMIPQGASLSLLQSSLGAGERAVGASFALIINSLIGAALGPLLVGMLSDAMAADYGVKSLNYALIIVSIGASIIGSIFYLWTARAMSAELVPDIEPDDEIEYT
ncbi:MFS transporter [Porticoccaceae bacterium]|jgi:predicted MFS family arabinose efflux permease|nr:MFS transporter [Porticoccaceae bacterium]|tara:strand:+ start:2933 stop:4219 length:1287 start_codon:yes stop_codon:yes gene_type:complete